MGTNKTALAALLVYSFILTGCGSGFTGLKLGSKKDTSLISPNAGRCIPSGDEKSIQAALKAPGDVAILCRNALFVLNAPVYFTAENQQIYTEGFPTDVSRAMLRLNNNQLAIAIMGINKSGIHIKNIIVDGNRPNLPARVSGALIEIGGDASDQVVQHVRAYEPKGWSTIAISQGSNFRCRNAQISNSEFGPSGQGIKDMWADGISLACRDSVVVDNTIVDATDGGIVIFGAPGSLIQNNKIIAVNRRLLGGINMVDWEPWQGNYTGTRVIGNTIDALNSAIKIGIGMGPRIWWGCGHKSDPQVNYGATVMNNTLKGNHFGFGFAASGVRDFTIQGNVSQAVHSGGREDGCRGLLNPDPSAHLRQSDTSDGSFQGEFQRVPLLEGLLFVTPTEGRDEQPLPIPTPPPRSEPPPAPAPSPEPQPLPPRAPASVIDDGMYRIRTGHTDKCLDVGYDWLLNGGDPRTEGKGMHQWDCASQGNQLWHVTSDHQGHYQMVGYNSGKCLDVNALAPTYGLNNGETVHQWDCAGTSNQIFTLVPSTRPGFYMIKSVNSGKCLDVANWGTHNGAAIQQWDCNPSADQPNQIWQFERM